MTIFNYIRLISILANYRIKTTIVENIAIITYFYASNILQLPSKTTSQCPTRKVQNTHGTLIYSMMLLVVLTLLILFAPQSSLSCFQQYLTKFKKYIVKCLLFLLWIRVSLTNSRYL